MIRRDQIFSPNRGLQLLHSGLRGALAGVLRLWPGGDGAYDISGLHVILEFLDLLLELVQADLLVLDDQGDLQFLDAEADGDELGGTPDQAVLWMLRTASSRAFMSRLVICRQPR